MTDVKKETQAGDVNEASTNGADGVQSASESAEMLEETAQDPVKELNAAKEENTQLKDKVLRMAAEFDNYKKRIERERQSSLKYAGEFIFRELLPVVDNLERALKTGIVEGAAAEKNLAALNEGVQLTFKSMISTLEKFEVKPIESIGQPFNPSQHEALTMEESETIPASHVVNEFEKGYYYKDRLLRAAKVIVSSGKKSTQA